MPTNVTVKLVQRADKVRADGTAPVYIRVTADRKTRQRATGVRVKPSEWNAKRCEVRARHPLYAALNARLEGLRLDAEREALRADSASAVTAKLRGDGASVQGYGAKIVAQFYEDGAFWQGRKYASTLRKAEAVFGADARFESITRKGLAKMDRYMVQKLGNIGSTRQKDFARLRRLFVLAQRDEVTEADPFRFFEMPRIGPTKKRKLSAEEIEALAAAPVTGAEAVARDAFLLAFYAAGMRFGDVATLRVGDVREVPGKGARVRYTMNKTKKATEVTIPPQAAEIAERYAGGRDAAEMIFPFVKPSEATDDVLVRKRINSANVMVNRHLKAVAAVAEIEPDGLTMHIARHSYADLARKRYGDLYAISQALGHSGLSVTQRYLSSLDEDAADKLGAAMWGANP